MEGLNSVTADKFDILSIAETKLDSSFPEAQFLIKGYNRPYRLDVSDTSGGLLVYVRKGLSSRYLKNFSLPNDIQFIPVELRLKSHKWLIIFIYRNPSQILSYFLEQMSYLLDFYSNIERYMLIGDFNCDPSDPCLDNFMRENNLYCHIKVNTCFKSREGSRIDLILSNQKHGLQKTGTLDTGLSDFHHLIYTQLKGKFSRLPAREVNYRCFRNYFLTDLSVQLTSTHIIDYNIFEDRFVSVLDRHTQQKRRVIRGNEKPHVNKTLRKAIMIRSRLRNKHQRSQRHSDWHAYRKQRNFVCSLNKKIRRTYFDSVASDTDNSSHHFWEICKPFFSDKHPVSEKILLVDKDEIISSDSQIALRLTLTSTT